MFHNPNTQYPVNTEVFPSMELLYRRLPTRPEWLKDRKGRELSFADIMHYQKIIKALVETDRLMQEVDNYGI